MRARVKQAIVKSRSRDADATYALAVWVGTIGGSAIGTDPDPNVTPPSNGRIVRVTNRGGDDQPAGVTAGGTVRIWCGVVAASSITFQAWVYDDTQARWFQFGAAATITPTGAAVNWIQLLPGGPYIGSKFFIQVTANTLVQALGYESN